jgi:hypothetical protein
VLNIGHKIEIVKKIERDVNRYVFVRDYNIGLSAIYDTWFLPNIQRNKMSFKRREKFPEIQVSEVCKPFSNF